MAKLVPVTFWQITKSEHSQMYWTMTMIYLQPQQVLTQCKIWNLVNLISVRSGGKWKNLENQRSASVSLAVKMGTYFLVDVEKGAF